MPDRDELIRRQREFEAVYEEVKAQLMQYPGVVGVGIGVKETGGEMTPQFAFRVYVEEKKDPSEIPPDEVIPEEIMGFLTDVHIVPTSTAIAFTERRDRQKYRAIRGGISIETEGRSSYGTLGWFGIRSSELRPRAADQQACTL